MSSLKKEEVLEDYRVGILSRETSLIGRREVLTGKAKFGIFGDGKEVPQLAMARAFRAGDFRSGYYRDQTFMLAAGMMTLDEFFAQLYADPINDSMSSGRQMNAHFATAMLDDDGEWRRLVDLKSAVSDTSPTSSQMPRLVGLAHASRLYRELDNLGHLADFSVDGNEIAFGTIGNASCAEGPFWESVNAAGVLGVPLLISIWDDEYGISVPNEYQITKENLSELLSGFAHTPGELDGFELLTVKGWDYPALCQAYADVTSKIRRDHVPAILHVVELTQPQGHSTSGSHERYKSKERLAWEEEHDCLRKMREWIEAEGLATADDLDALEKEAIQEAREAQRRALAAFTEPIKAEHAELAELLANVAAESENGAEVEKIAKDLARTPGMLRRHLMQAIHRTLLVTRNENGLASKAPLIAWRDAQDAVNQDRYSSHLYSASAHAALDVPEIPAVFSSDSKTLAGFEVVNRCFDAALERHPELVAFGEDVGQLGDVNQGFSGLQKKYGVSRVADTGIRECTILGQAIGMAMRGLRPLAEIQYLDYVPYALQLMSDDLATLSYRTRGRQKAPVIVRTRGHRLEGIWHTGSPMAGILNLIRGIYLCVPRDMTQAAGFYNTMLRSDDSAIIVEVLNGYRLKEKLPDNISEFTIPLGVPEILRPGRDVTVVTYGACCRIAEAAAEELAEVGVDVEIIDVRTLLPFDRHGLIGESLQKTNRIVFLDEDVPGGASAYMMQQVLETQQGWAWLDSEPRTLTAGAHRPPYGSDGDYWSKPSAEDIFRTVYELMHEAEPQRFPLFYR